MPNLTELILNQMINTYGSFCADKCPMNIQQSCLAVNCGCPVNKYIAVLKEELGPVIERVDK